MEEGASLVILMVGFYGFLIKKIKLKISRKKIKFYQMERVESGT